MEMLEKGGSRRELLPIAKRLTSYEQFAENLGKFMESESLLWFINQTETGINIKPLRGDVFAEELLFSRAEHIVMMSATILDPKTFTRNLGINPKECGYMSLPSEFPVSNRQVIFAPAGSMSFKNYDTTLPKLLKRIDRVLTKHSEEKGIIHCNSFKLSQHIMDHFAGTPHGARLLTHDSKNRGMVVDYHMTSSKPTVLLSPSMTEGLDLRDDLSRFQVIAKCPWGSLADPYIRTRMEMDETWYTWQACLHLVQSIGRSVRSKDDYATSYILDSDTIRLFNSGMLPEWWLEALEFR
jgi:Rad3-related DNA helicase